MTSISEKGGGAFAGIKLLLCENPLPPLDEAIAAACEEVPRSNYYTEPYSAPLRRVIAEQLGVPERLIHINAGSELILRQLFDRFGQQVHLLTPTYPLFPEIARRYTETPLSPESDFGFDLSALRVPEGTTLVTIVNPNNPNGEVFDMAPLPGLLRRHRDTLFLVDEAFIGLAGESVAPLVPAHPNLIVTRTLSKAHSLAGFRVGYAVLPEPLADDLNAHNDAYPLARPSEAAAVATLRNEPKIAARLAELKRWTAELAAELRALDVRTYPTRTYFFLADFAPHDAARLAAELKARNILVKALNDPRLGKGFMRITTALPRDNARFLENLRALLETRVAKEVGGTCAPEDTCRSVESSMSEVVMSKTEDAFQAIRGAAGVSDPRFPHAPAEWTPGTAVEIAQQEQLTLGDDHWAVVRGLQEFFARHEDGVTNLRELHDALDEKFHHKGGMKYLYTLLPGGPIAQGCRLAGLRPPAGAVDRGFGSVA